MSALTDALKRIMENPGHEFNTGLGALYGLATTRKLPIHDPEGRMVFEGAEGLPPRAIGDVLIKPEGDLSERTEAHENVHRGQSQELGFAYPFYSLMGGSLGPLEYEALKKTRGIGSNPDDDIADRFEMMDAEKKSMEPGLSNLLYRMYYGR